MAEIRGRDAASGGPEPDRAPEILVEDTDAPAFGARDHPEPPPVRIGIITADLDKFKAANGENARPIQPQAAAIVDFTGQAIRTSGASVQPGAGMAYNNEYGGWRLTSARSSFQVTFKLGSVPRGDVRGQRANGHQPPLHGAGIERLTAR